MATRKEVQGWVREIARLAPDAPVEVNERGGQVFLRLPNARAVEVHESLLHLTWGRVALSLLPALGPSCTERH